MRVVRFAIGAVGEVLVTAGLVLLLFVGWQLWWTDVEANHAQSGTISALEKDFRGSVPGSPTTQTTQTTPADKRVHPPELRLGDAFAIIRIPRFGSDYARPVLEGTDHDILQQGMGHYVGTAGPGQVGNFALAGHRTTYGRPLHDIDKLAMGDRIVLETKSGYLVYAVQSHEIVAPTRVSVIAPVPDRPGQRPTQRWLTMTACHPKYSAAERYVVHATLAASYPRSEGLPPGVLAAPKSKA